MEAEASSRSFYQGHAYLDPKSSNPEPTIAQPQLNIERLDVEDPIALLSTKTDQIQPKLPPDHSENTALNAKLAKKDKQLKAARQELSRVKGEKTRLKQELVSTRWDQADVRMV